MILEVLNWDWTISEWDTENDSDFDEFLSDYSREDGTTIVEFIKEQVRLPGAVENVVFCLNSLPAWQKHFKEVRERSQSTEAFVRRLPIVRNNKAP